MRRMTHQKSKKIRLTQKFKNVVLRVMDPSSGLKGGKALELNKIVCGFLKIPPGELTKPEVSAQTEIYIVLNVPPKALKFKLGENVWRMSKNDVFVVPRNNQFSLENLHLKRSVLLAFIMTKDKERNHSRTQSKKQAPKRNEERPGEKKESNKSKSRKSRKSGIEAGENWRVTELNSE